MDKAGPYTPAERQRIRRDQQDPSWTAWLARMDEQIETFLNTTVPDMPSDPWTADGLRHAERAALQLFPSGTAGNSQALMRVTDQFHRYFGEVFRRNFAGEWFNAPVDRSSVGVIAPMLKEPYKPVYLDILPILAAALVLGTGEVWRQIFTWSEQEYLDWKFAGQAPITRWVHARQDGPGPGGFG